VATLNDKRSTFSRVTRALFVLFCGIFALACAGAAYQFIGAHIDRSKNPPPGDLVDVGGFRMHIDCVGSASGAGAPTVILDSGMSDSWLSWHKVQPAVAEFARVCSYDRAGLGWSDPSPRPRTGKVFAQELHTLLQNAKVTPPYILVGHSMGGYDVRMFTSLFRSEVAGVVLVDSTHPDLFDRLPKVRQETLDWCRELKWQEWEMVFGIPRLLNSCNGEYPDSAAMRHTIECRENYVRETRAECLSIQSESGIEVRATGDFGDLPLVVLTEDPDKNTQEYLPVFNAGQIELSHLSTNGKQIIAKGSGHQIQLERPDLVIQAIRDVAERSRPQ
jgi:pimeloyl-ACP methyl ester carboxylesterase